MDSSIGDDVRILPAAENDLGSIVELFAAHRFALQKREWLEWKYWKNPDGKARVYKVVGAGGLVGAVALLPRLFCHQGRSVWGIQAVDGLVTREARGRGIFNAMNRFLVTQEMPGTGSSPFFFAFASMPGSKRAMENAGWRVVANFETSFCPLRPGGLGGRPALRLAAGMTAPAWPLLRRALCRGASPEIEIQRIDRFTDDMAARFPSDMVQGVRSAEFMNWRVCDNPMERMAAFSVRRQGRLAGYAVGRLRDRKIEIVELRLESPQDDLAGTLFKHLCDLGTINAVEHFALGPNGRVPAISRRCFLRRRHDGAMFAYHLERAELPVDPHLWDVTFLDSDW